MPNIPVNNCCGCTACASICPVSAIDMQPDREGFLYPQVDSQKCISCGLCEKVCPILHMPVLPETYAAAVVAQSTQEEVLEESTSGGFIDGLIRYVLEEQDGYAVGVAFDKGFMPVHQITNSYEKAKAFRNSKYAQSDLRGIFSQVKTLLQQGKTVIFVGTPCQVAGLLSFLQKPYSNLIAVDLVCRSVPSPKLWKAYLQWQEVRHSQKITNVACRKKTYGYHNGALEIVFSGGKKYAGSNRVDYFMKCFHHDVCSRPSCYDCQFKTSHRCSDLTVFDCWNPQIVAQGLERDDNRGWSNVIAHTEKGRELLNNISRMRTYPAEPEKMFRFTGGMESKSIEKPEVRETFYSDLERLGFYDTVRKYVTVSIKDRMIESVKPIWFGAKRVLCKK